ncbi:MAG: lytic transglycosylase domain-containing protein [Minisyncoccia bacterium]
MPREPNRRDFLKALAGLGVTASVSSSISEREQREIPSPSREAHLTAERVERPKEHMGEALERRLAFHREFYTTFTRNYITFLDEEGMPLGEPVPIETYNGNVPGTFDENGFISKEGGFNQEWLDAHRKEISSRHGVPFREGQLPRQMNVVLLIRDSVSDTALVPSELTPMERKKFLDQLTLIDVVRHFGTSTTEQELGTEGVAPLECIRSQVASWGEEAENLESRDIFEELAYFIPALGAQESQFNNKVRSRAGAKGIMQFMPATWRTYGNKDEDYASLPTQIDTAHKYFTNAYKVLSSEAAGSLREVRALFPDDASFKRFFLVPVLLNSYNVGENKMVEILEWFVETQVRTHTVTHALGSSYGVYSFMAHTAARSDDKRTDTYGRDSSEYFERILALRDLVSTL